MAEDLTCGSAVTGNKEIRNLVPPYGMRGTASLGFKLAVGSSGSRGVFGSGFQAISTTLACSFRGAFNGQSHVAGIAARSTVNPGSWTSSSNSHRGDGLGV